jgi:hypothetical protein
LSHTKSAVLFSSKSKSALRTIYRNATPLKVGGFEGRFYLRADLESDLESDLRADFLRSDLKSDLSAVSNSEGGSRGIRMRRKST